MLSALAGTWMAEAFAYIAAHTPSSSNPTMKFRAMGTNGITHDIHD
jgi:hypothetical protein